MLSREQGWEAVMRVHCSRGVSIKHYYGCFYRRSADLLSMPTIDADKTVTVHELKLEPHDADDDDPAHKPGLFDDEEDDAAVLSLAKTNDATQTETETASKHAATTSRSEELTFLTPSGSKKSSSSSLTGQLINPMLKDLPPGPLETDKKTSLDLSNSTTSPATTPKGTGAGSEEKTQLPTIVQGHTHAKTDSTVLLNGQPLDLQPAKGPDPLSAAPNNPWKTYFDDWEIWNRI